MKDLKDVNMDNIPLYNPSGAVAKRLYDYLEKVYELHPNTYVKREQLYLVGAKYGLKQNEVYNALKELERVVNCISFWDSNERTVFYMVANFSAEDKMRMIDDALWFERLPG